MTNTDDAVDVDVDVLSIFDRRNINSNNNNSNYNDDNDGRLSLTTLPLPLLIIIVNNVGTQEDLVTISVLSKQFYLIVHLPAIETRIIRIYEISSSKNNNRGSQRKFLQRLVHNRLNNNDKFSQYHHFKINGINKFDYDLTDADVNDITNNVPPINNVEVLDLSLSPASATSPAKAHILYGMGNLLSNVQEINLSHVRFDNDYEQLGYLRQFFESLSSRQKIIWHHCDRDVYLNSFLFSSTSTKQIYMDGSIFAVTGFSIRRMSNLERHDDTFMFHSLKSLECLSIRNAKYTHAIRHMNIPQNILIKFVRHAPPSMRWFRSDLSKANMDMLTKERPDIELLN